jgi:hypothetical protein
MNVLVIPEDFRLDQYILQPLFEAVLAAVGKPRAKVRVVTDPLLGGVTEALKWSNIEAVIDRYRGMVQLFILIVDRDGDAGRRAALNDLEQRAEALCHFVAENAWQEVEVWALAAQDVPWRWSDVRAEPHAKERFFEPFVATRGLQDEPGRGRKTLGREAASRYTRVRQLCPEDVGAMEGRIRNVVAAL